MKKPLALLVEDDLDLLQLTALVLEQEGIQVVTAENGERALSMLEHIEPDVIVTDMMMPELDGLGFLQRYARKPPPRAPVVAVSGFLPYLEQARSLGATEVLSKPYNPRALAELVLALATGQAHAPASPGAPAFLEDESMRLRAVLDLRLAEPDPELGLQRFLDDVADLFSVPVAGVSAVTEDEQRLVAQCSLAPPDPGGRREHSFCTHAVAARAALVIQDASENPFFRANPSVIERGFRFYAGVPLMASQGEAVGTLCILDFQPHHFSHLDLELLGVLARRVLAALEWRDKRRRPDVPDSVYRCLQCVDEELGVYGRAVFTDFTSVEASRGLERNEPVALAVVAAPHHRLQAIVDALGGAVRGGLIGRLGRARLGVIVPNKNAEEARSIVAQCAGAGALVVASALDQHQGATALALLHAEQALGAAGL